MTNQEMFEAWAKFQLLPLDKNENGLYINQNTHYARKAWQAAQQREGYKFVPVEPTEVMINTYRDKSIAPISTLSIRGYKAMIGAAP